MCSNILWVKMNISKDKNAWQRNNDSNGIVLLYSGSAPSLYKKLVNLIALASSTPFTQDSSIQRSKPHKGLQKRPVYGLYLSSFLRYCSLTSSSANVDRLSRYPTHILAPCLHLRNLIDPSTVILLKLTQQMSPCSIVTLISCKIALEAEKTALQAASLYASY